MKRLGGPEFEVGPLSVPMYVLSNQKSTAGAAMVLYDDLLQEAARKIGGDLCVIPSSVHEVILAPGEGVNVLELQELIRDMNNRVVRPGDLLSNTPYMYDAQAHELKPADVHPIERTSSRDARERDYEPVFQPAFAGSAR